jgi:hypothetical protein
MSRRTLNPEKFLNGTLSPQEFVALNTFGPRARCGGCGGLPVIKATVFMPYDECVRRELLPPGHEASQRVLSAVLMLRTGANKALEPHVRVSEVFSCRVCQTAFEKQLAKAPSWAVVDINRGPDPSNRVQVAHGHTGEHVP